MHHPGLQTHALGQGQQGGRGGLFVGQKAQGVVFHQGKAVGSGQLEQPLKPGFLEAQPGGVVVAGNGVVKARTVALQKCLEHLQPGALGVERHGQGLEAKLFENAQQAQVGGFFQQDLLARFGQGPADQGQPLQPPYRNQHLLGVGPDAPLLQQFAQGHPKLGLAHQRAVAKNFLG